MQEVRCSKMVLFVLPAIFLILKVVDGAANPALELLAALWAGPSYAATHSTGLVLGIPPPHVHMVPAAAQGCGGGHSIVFRKPTAQGYED